MGYFAVLVLGIIIGVSFGNPTIRSILLRQSVVKVEKKTKREGVK